MNKLKEMVEKSSPVHERKVEIRSYVTEDNQLVVEGWLRDDRLEFGYYWDGRERPPGVVHWMGVRLLIGGWPITIQDAEVEMPGIPHEICRETMDSVKKIIGLPIVSGFSEEVRQRLGGTESCTHLMYLIITMGPAALHGYLAQQSRRRQPVPKSMEDIPWLSYVINSCQLWREGGPLLQMVQETLERLNHPE